MNFSEALSKLEKSAEFSKFKQEHPEAYLCVGFFVIDFEAGNNQQSLDFQLGDMRIATFSLDENINFKIEDSVEKGKLPEINKKIEVEIDDLQEIVDKELEKKDMSKSMKKIIAILQKHEGRQIWNLTCMLESFLILRLHIDALSGKVLKSERLSLFDFIKKQ